MAIKIKQRDDLRTSIAVIFVISKVDLTCSSPTHYYQVNAKPHVALQSICFSFPVQVLYIIKFTRKSMVPPFSILLGLFWSRHFLSGNQMSFKTTELAGFTDSESGKKYTSFFLVSNKKRKV